MARKSMKKFILLAVVAMLGLSSCDVNAEHQKDDQMQKQEKEKYFHPVYIGGRWYYIYY